jgi:hypothetical protein
VEAKRAMRAEWKLFDRHDDHVVEGTTIERWLRVNETGRDQVAKVRRPATSSA